MCGGSGARLRKKIRGVMAGGGGGGGGSVGVVWDKVE